MKFFNPFPKNTRAYKLFNETGNPFKKDSKAHRFFNIAEVDIEDGHSREVPINEIESMGLGFGNGADWARSDGPLGNLFNIDRIKGKKQGNKIIAVQLCGYKKNRFNKHISKKIRDELKKEACRILYVRSDIQIDHKDGQKDDYGPEANQKISDFQPLHRTANDAKRTHCKKCRATKIRFDAKNLGYNVSQWKGPNEYKGSCIGCYWYDPLEFNKQISEKYKKER